MAWGNMMGWDGGWGPGWAFFGLVHVLWWVLILIGLVALVRWTLVRGPRASRPPEEDRALAILRERYARGEIDKAQFEERKQDLAR
jgi:putative membrane protein